VAYFFSTKEPLAEGSSSQAITLCENADFFEPVSIQPLSGAESEQFASVPSDRLGEIKYPIPPAGREENILPCLEEMDPDAVMIHTVGTYLLNEVRQIAKEYPTALRLGMNPIEFYFYSKQVDQILWSLDNVDCVIAPSELVKENLEAMGLRNVVRIPTAVDLDKWDKSNGDSQRVVTISRVDPIKNHITSIFAMKQLGKELPNLEYKIYGKGGSTGLLRRIVELTGSDWISLEGFKPAREALSEAKVFLQTSISENQSLVALEALASGVPSVVSDIRGHPQSASRVSHESMSEISAEVKRLLTDEDYWKTKRKEGLEEVKNHDVEKILPKYKRLFKTLLRLRGFKTESKVLEVGNG